MLSALAFSAHAGPVTEATLANGLRVVIEPTPARGLVSVAFCIKAAPLYEPAGKAGVANAVRFMAFDYASAGAPPLALQLVDLGCRFESYTSTDATQVRLTLAAAALPEMLPRLVAGVFEPVLTEEAWAGALPQLRRRLTDRREMPTERLEMALWESAFDTHPYRNPVEGTPDTVGDLNSEDLRACHQQLWAPGNMALLAVGDVDPEQFLALARECLERYPAREVSLPQVAREAPLASPRSRLERTATRATILSFAWRAPGIERKRDVCAIDLIYALLGEGPDARLVKSLLLNEAIQSLPEVQFVTRRDPGLLVITCLCPPDKEFDVRETVLAEVKALRDAPITQADLAEARRLIRDGYLLDNQGISGDIGSMAFYEAIDSYAFAHDYLAEVDRVTVQDIQRVARAYLGASSYILAIMRPRTTGSEGTLEARLNP